MNMYNILLGALSWGDSQWFFFGDVDGNILTLYGVQLVSNWPLVLIVVYREQWYPQRYWGERA